MNASNLWPLQLQTGSEWRSVDSSHVCWVTFVTTTLVAAAFRRVMSNFESGIYVYNSTLKLNNYADMYF